MDRLIEWNEDWTPEWGGQKSWTLHFVPPSRLTMQNPEPNFGLKPLIPRRELWKVEADGSVVPVPIFWGGIGFNVGNINMGIKDD